MVRGLETRLPRMSNVFDGGDPARGVAVKNVLNGLASGTRTGGVVLPSRRISITRFSETVLPDASAPET